MGQRASTGAARNDAQLLVTGTRVNVVIDLQPNSDVEGTPPSPIRRSWLR